MSEPERNKGCEDIRQAHIAIMQELTKPEIFLAKQIAEIQIETDFKKLKDGKLDEGLSKERKELMYLLKDFTKLYLDLQDMRAKYCIGETKNIKVTHIFDPNETISIKPNKKEDKDN